MNHAEAKQILQQLVEGIDPLTGEYFPMHHVCNEPDVIRALYTALNALDACIEAPTTMFPPSQTKKSTRSSRANQDKPWTPEEDQYLRNAHECRTTYEQMAAQLLRSPRSIKRRSVYLDLASRKILGWSRSASHRREHQGLPWYPEEDQLLIQLFHAGCNMQEIADKLKRSVGAIESRLEKQGLIENKHIHQ